MWGWAWLGLAAAHGLVVESGTPNALCPDLASTRAAVLTRVGSVAHPEGKPYRLRYTVDHASDQPVVRVELFDANGQLQLSRELPLPEGDCQTAAQSIAVVVERYFRPLDDASTKPEIAEERRQENDPSRDTADPPPKVPEASKPEGASATSDVAERELPPLARAAEAPGPTGMLPPPARPGSDAAPWSVWLGPWVGWGSGATALVGLQLLARATSWLDLALTPSFATHEREQQFDGAAVRAWSFPARIAALYRFQWNQSALQLGPEVLVLAESARTRGFEPPRDGTRWALGIGARAGLEQRLGAAWALTLQGGVDWIANSLVQPFEVNGEEVLPPTRIQAFAAAGVTMRLF